MKMDPRLREGMSGALPLGEADIQPGMDASDGRKHATWVARNREPILAVLQRVLPPRGKVLELACGTGEHAAFFAPHLPGRTWLPTEVDDASLTSARAWRKHANVDNVLEPMVLNVLDDVWPVDEVDVVVAMNLIHIAPWSVCEALMRGAGRVLREGGLLFLYGPFFRDGVPPAPSNLAFDEDLRRRNPAWGVRDLGQVSNLAREHALSLREIAPMPSNNLSVVFERGRR